MSVLQDLRHRVVVYQHFGNSWRWRHQGHPKRWYRTTSVRCVITQPIFTVFYTSLNLSSSYKNVITKIVVFICVYTHTHL